MFLSVLKVIFFAEWRFLKSTLGLREVIGFLVNVRYFHTGGPSFFNQPISLSAADSWPLSQHIKHFGGVEFGKIFIQFAYICKLIQ